VLTVLDEKANDLGHVGLGGGPEDQPLGSDDGVGRRLQASPAV
jgi:hypothetical protein